MNHGPVNGFVSEAGPWAREEGLFSILFITSLIVGLNIIKTSYNYAQSSFVHPF